MKTKVKSRIKAKYLNSILRVRRRSGPSLRAERAFVLGSSLRKIPHYTIQIFGFSLIISFGLINLLSINSAFALSYSSNNGNSNSIMSFTFNLDSNLAISVSGDLNIADLSPGSSSDSNIITVGVNTNNATGYSLSATVGNESNPTTDLVHGDDISSNISNSSSNNSNGNAKFTSLSPSDSLINLTTDNTWGYSYSIDTNSTNSSNTTWSNYSGLPIYTSPGIKLNYKNSPTIDKTNFKIAAKSGNTQAAGVYTNVINFIAVPNPETHYYIQDFTLPECQTLATNDHFTVYDKRDEKDYTVRYINGQCWMTQNLRFVGSKLDSATSNVASTYTEASPLTISYGDLVSGNSYVEARIHSGTDNNGNATVWYNYAAASAMDVIGNDNEKTAVYDVCPSGWHLPSGPSTASGTDFNKFMGNTTSGWQNNARYSVFNPSDGGFYSDGGLIGNTRQCSWWSNSSSDSRSRYYMGYRSSVGFYGDGFDGLRYHGNFIRCVRSS